MKRYIVTLLVINSVATFCYSMSTRADSLNINRKNTELLMEKSNMELALSNPGILGKFFVIGTLSFYGNHLVYQVYSDSIFLANADKVNRYNYLIKDFEIEYDKIKEVRGGFFFLFLHRKIIVELDKKISYRFIAANSSDRREILKFINDRINKGSN
jgi:hypothetical protein